MDVIWEQIEKWGLKPYVVAFSFDTCATNTGDTNGTCTLLDEKFIHSNKLMLACRHHMLELFLGSAFEAHFEKSSAPTLGGPFLRVQKEWISISKTHFNRLVVPKPLWQMKTTAIEFLKNVEKSTFIRGDYAELVELSLMLLDDDSSYSIKAPAGMSKARWMVKAIYAMKLFMFQKQFSLPKPLVDKLKKICLFITLIYCKAWIMAPLTCEAAVNDLRLLKDLKEFKKFDDQCYSNVSEKLMKHSWYLGGELVGFALFSEKLEETEKLKIVKELQSIPADWNTRSLKAKPELFSTTSLSNFVNNSTIPALKHLGIPVNELFNSHPSEWPKLNWYVASQKVIRHLTSTNNPAERAVKTMSEFNDLFTKNETVKQQVIRNVEFVRQEVPKPKKQNLSNLTNI